MQTVPRGIWEEWEKHWMLEKILWERFPLEEVDRILKQDAYLSQKIEELAANPLLRAQYEAIILHWDRNVLEEKTKKQIWYLRDLFYENEAMENGDTIVGDIHAKVQKRMKLIEFAHVVDRMIPIRGDDNNGFQEFLSPEKLGMWRAKNLGMYDAFVQAHKYVYGTFDLLQHTKARRWKRNNLDERDIENRAEIVMIDIAGFDYHDSRSIRRYMNNIFDYRQGKELLALYLAYVFETPEEAFVYLWSKGNKWQAEKDWCTDFSEPGAIHDALVWNNLLDQDRIQILMKPGAIDQHDIYRKMRTVFDATGVTPPLNLEIRVKDSAKIVPQ